MRSAALLMLYLAAQAPATLDAPYPFRAADPLASPRISKLRADIHMEGAKAVDKFWNEMRMNSAPIIEAIPGDERHSLVTFVWQGSPEAKNVVITDGVSVGIGDAEPLHSQMTNIPETNVWYRTYDVRNDARFTYSLSENDPLAFFTDPARKSNSKADPLNPRKFSTGADLRRTARCAVAAMGDGAPVRDARQSGKHCSERHESLGLHTGQFSTNWDRISASGRHGRPAVYELHIGYHHAG